MHIFSSGPASRERYSRSSLVRREVGTGLLTTSNDVAALVALLQYGSQHRLELKQLGLRLLNYAHEMTHQRCIGSG